jgi:mercuric ion transport protein
MAIETRGLAANLNEHNGLAKALSVGGILAALGASSCCVIPFVLFSLGVSGAWIADVTALEPYQPVFVALAMACLGGGFVLARRKSRAACADGSYCARPVSDRVVRMGLWMAAVLVIVAIGFPRLASFFLSN